MISFRIGFDIFYLSTCYFMLLGQQTESSMTMSPTTIFLFSTAIGVVAGLASLMRSDKRRITTRDIFSHTLNMGTCGASLSMLLYVYLTPQRGTDFLIIAIVGILSLMGLPLINFVTELGRGIIKGIVNTHSNGNKNNDG